MRECFKECGLPKGVADDAQTAPVGSDSFGDGLVIL